MPLALSNYLAHSYGPTSPEAHVEALLSAVAGHALSYAHREVIDHLAHTAPGRCRDLVEQLVHVDPRRRATAWGVLNDSAIHAARAARGLNTVRNRRQEIWQ